ncbi:hypothetical protein OAI00_03990 [Euryarchaeota archaeon]|nr:hypothetical protein [Euryarchaeota archaeon]MDB4865507.1 hypothetical protein [Euryarchaeota archaeon]
MGEKELTWPYLVQDIMDEISRNKLSLIVVVVVTLISIIIVSILPFLSGFWDIPYAVGILIFFGFFTTLPVMFFYIKIFLGVRKKNKSKET